MLNADIITRAYRAGLIQLIASPFGDGIVAKVRSDFPDTDLWFYFGGETAEQYSDPEHFRRDIPQADIERALCETLLGFYDYEELRDEVAFYDAVLRERLSEPVRLYDALIKQATKENIECPDSSAAMNCEECIYTDNCVVHLAFRLAAALSEAQEKIMDLESKIKNL